MASHFARYLAATGHCVIETASGEWYDAGERFFLNLPFHREITPAPDELRDVLRRGRALGVKFVAPWQGPGHPSYRMMCDARDYGFTALSPNTRSKVRRGLRRCDIRPVSFGFVSERGRRAHVDTMRRQRRLGRDRMPNWTRWEQLWRVAAETTGMQAWGALVGEDLAAFLLTVRLEDRVEFLLARSMDAHLDKYPNNALVFAVTSALMQRPDVVEAMYGIESLEPVESLEQFKMAMGFRPRRLRQRVIFHPLLHSVLAHSLLRGMARSWTNRLGPRVPWLRKVDGLLRFAEDELSLANRTR